MLNPVSGRCTQYFGDVLRQIQFQTELEGYFLDAGQEPPKRGIFRFPTEASKDLKPQSQTGRVCLWAQASSEAALSCL